MTKLPKCPEVCKDCVSGKHAFHVMGELSDLEGYMDSKNIMKLSGWVEIDPESAWLAQLIRIANRELNYEKLPTGCQDRYKAILQRSLELSSTFSNGNREDTVKALVALEPRAALAIVAKMMMLDPAGREDLSNYLMEAA